MWPAGIAHVTCSHLLDKFANQAGTSYKSSHLFSALVSSCLVAHQVANKLDMQCICFFSGAKWLATTFFQYCAEALAHPNIAVISPADAAFLTQADVELFNWGQERGQGEAWKQSVQTALKQFTLKDYCRVSMQRYPRALASAGVYEAGRQHGLHCTAAHCMCLHIQCCCHACQSSQTLLTKSTLKCSSDETSALAMHC